MVYSCLDSNLVCLHFSGHSDLQNSPYLRPTFSRWRSNICHRYFSAPCPAELDICHHLSIQSGRRLFDSVEVSNPANRKTMAGIGKSKILHSSCSSLLVSYEIFSTVENTGHFWTPQRSRSAMLLLLLACANISIQSSKV
jgi:hypothetical protein